MEERLEHGGMANAAYDPCYHQACDSVYNVDGVILNQVFFFFCFLFFCFLLFFAFFFAFFCFFFLKSFLFSLFYYSFSSFSFFSCVVGKSSESCCARVGHKIGPEKVFKYNKMKQIK